MPRKLVYIIFRYCISVDLSPAVFLSKSNPRPFYKSFPAQTAGTLRFLFSRNSFAYRFLFYFILTIFTSYICWLSWLLVSSWTHVKCLSCIYPIVAIQNMVINGPINSAAVPVSFPPCALSVDLLIECITVLISRRASIKRSDWFGRKTQSVPTARRLCTGLFSSITRHEKNTMETRQAIKDGIRTFFLPKHPLAATY